MRKDKLTPPDLLPQYGINKLQCTCGHQLWHHIWVRSKDFEDFEIFYSRCFGNDCKCKYPKIKEEKDGKL